MSPLNDLYIQMSDLIKNEFKNSPDIQLALNDIKDSVTEFEELLDKDIEDIETKTESIKILLEKLKDNVLLSNLSEKNKELVSKLSIKYDKEIPSDNFFREYIFRRIVDLKDETVLNLAYGRKNLENIGNGDYSLGIKRIHKDSFLPRNIESVYGKAISNIYKHEGLFVAFLVDFFRNKK